MEWIQAYVCEQPNTPVGRFTQSKMFDIHLARLIWQYIADVPLILEVAGKFTSTSYTLDTITHRQDNAYDTKDFQIWNTQDAQPYEFISFDDCGSTYLPAYQFKGFPNCVSVWFNFCDKYFIDYWLKPGLFPNVKQIIVEGAVYPHVICRFSKNQNKIRVFLSYNNKTRWIDREPPQNMTLIFSDHSVYPKHDHHSDPPTRTRNMKIPLLSLQVAEDQSC